MRRSIQAAALGLVLGMAAIAGTRRVESQEVRGVLVGLKVGQQVTLQDVSSACVIRVTDLKMPTGQEVAEVGKGYVVVKTQAWARSASG